MPLISTLAGSSARGLGGMRTFTPASALSYDSIATTTLTASTPSITFSAISASYSHLQIRGTIIGTNATQTGSTTFQINGDTGANYTRHQLGGGGATAFGYASVSQTAIYVYGYNDNLNNVTPQSFIIDILDYANTNKYKTVRTLSGSERNGTSPYGDINLVSGMWMNTNAITSLVISVGGQNMGQYSQIALYGVK